MENIYELILGSPETYLMRYLGDLEILALKREWFLRVSRAKAVWNSAAGSLREGLWPFEIIRDSIIRAAK